MTTLKQTPSQTVGPYFAYGLCPQQYNFDLKSLFSGVVADREAAGEHITVVGQVFDGDGAVIGDAMIEVQQVDSEGRYPQSREEVAKTGFRGFARFGTGTDPHKRFVIETVKPGRASHQRSKNTVSFGPCMRMSNRYTVLPPCVSRFAISVARRSVGTLASTASLSFAAASSSK